MAKSREAFRTISEVADWLGVQSHVLRFWESKFSQVKPVKRAGGRRYYRPEDMELLGGIKKLLHEDGVPIKDAQKMLREKGVKHVSAMSQPVDDIGSENDVTEDNVAQSGIAEDQTERAEAPQAEIEPPETDDIAEDPSNETEADSTNSETVEDEPDPLNATAEEPTTSTPSSVHDESGLNTEPPEETAQSAELHETSAASPLLTPASSDDAPLIGQFIKPSLEAPIEEGAPTAKAPTAPADSLLPPTTGDLFSELEQPSPSEADPSGELTQPQKAVSEEYEAEQPLLDETRTSENGSVAGEVAQQPPISLDQTGLPPSETDSEGTPATEEGDINRNSEEPASPSDHGMSAAEPPFPRSSEPLAIEAKSDSAAIDPHAASAKIDHSQEEAASSPKVPVGTEAPQSPDTTSSLSSEDQNIATSGRENKQDEFLQMFSKPVSMPPENKTRAASLLARLEALHKRAG
ncbi:MerR family transcriptional regulator [Shimia sp.]|uniref:MerR family transcriptional regulator n=1 Tax=Shimia sp. TaxID=1954381 RepID=UPI003B8AFDC9